MIEQKKTLLNIWSIIFLFVRVLCECFFSTVLVIAKSIIPAIIIINSYASLLCEKSDLLFLTFVDTFNYYHTSTQLSNHLSYQNRAFNGILNIRSLFDRERKRDRLLLFLQILLQTAHFVNSSLSLHIA